MTIEHRMKRISLLVTAAALLLGGACTQPLEPRTPAQMAPTQAPPPVRPLPTPDQLRVSTQNEFGKTSTFVDRISDLTYATVGGLQLKLDFYRPVGVKGVFPGVVLVHGGGWGAFIEHVAGGGVNDTPETKEEMAGIAKKIAAAGFSVFAVEYGWACSFERIPPNAPSEEICGFRVPSQQLHVGTAFAWIRSNAAVFDVDPEGLGELGFGSGGSLALVHASTGSDPPQAVASWSGLADLRLCILTKSCQPIGAYIGNKLRERPDLWEENSPISLARSTMPPVYLANGASEVTPLADVTAYRDRLEALGVSVELRVIGGTQARSHADRLEDDDTGNGTTVLQETIQFFQANL